ncbi:hypothetical protein GCM10007392_19890 [Saccharospirillum salsuginis]|uniref:Uncharacterized protein n=2 Tax=Saccharospirillum salsuginis TaxID=418750 RepID=A0A918K9A0_9GAMM|nr:hypothetical protein GCM10007392_19890 [Saccharospirillum salsuginis]
MEVLTNQPPFLFLYLASPLVLIEIYYILKIRTGGEDTWILLDRTTGNVCFWKRNSKKSLTVPFDQVDCYWSTRAGRGGPSHQIALMPKVNLPNERYRYWEIMLGSAAMYEQAQYFWRVMNDFMDRTRPIPEVPGLIHQVRSMEKLGWRLEDITHGGKEVPIEEWEEVEKELRRDAEALEARLERLFTPEYFDAQTVYDFYQKAPVHFKRDALRNILSKYEMFAGAGRYPGFEYWKEEYDSEVIKLGELLSKLPSRESFYMDYS